MLRAIARRMPRSGSRRRSPAHGRPRLTAAARGAHVGGGDAPVGSAADERREVDAELTRQLADRRRRLRRRVGPRGCHEAGRCGPRSRRRSCAPRCRGERGAGRRGSSSSRVAPTGTRSPTSPPSAMTVPASGTGSSTSALSVCTWTTIWSRVHVGADRDDPADDLGFRHALAEVGEPVRTRRSGIERRDSTRQRRRVRHRVGTSPRPAARRPGGRTRRRGRIGPPATRTPPPGSSPRLRRRSRR